MFMYAWGGLNWLERIWVILILVIGICFVPDLVSSFAWGSSAFFVYLLIEVLCITTAVLLIWIGSLNRDTADLEHALLREQRERRRINRPDEPRNRNPLP